MQDFKIISHNELNYDSVALDSRRIKSCLDFMKANNIKNLSINSEWGWSKNSKLDFIEENLWIEGVEIIDEEIEISNLNKLSKLERLALAGTNFKGEINFANFPKLKSFNGFWNSKNYHNLNHCIECKYLYISKFPFESLEIIRGLLKLETLIISYGKLTTLQGIDGLKELRKVDLYSLPNLVDIDDLNCCSESLDFLSIDKCKKIGKYPSFDKMKNLKRLFISDSIPLDSIGFIDVLKKIEFAYFGVDILDKNISILKERKFEFKNSKKYLL